MNPIKLPLLDAENYDFWTSGAEGKLKIHYCPSCRHYQHPPLSVCPLCENPTQAKAVSGRGKVMTWSINYQAWLPNQDVPFILAVIELEEQAGLWVMSNVVHCSPQDVTVNLPVEVEFLQHEEIWLPLFKPRAVS